MDLRHHERARRDLQQGVLRDLHRGAGGVSDPGCDLQRVRPHVRDLRDHLLLDPRADPDGAGLVQGAHRAEAVPLLPRRGPPAAGAAQLALSAVQLHPQLRGLVHHVHVYPDPAPGIGDRVRRETAAEPDLLLLLHLYAEYHLHDADLSEPEPTVQHGVLPVGVRVGGGEGEQHLFQDRAAVGDDLPHDGDPLLLPGRDPGLPPGERKLLALHLPSLRHPGDMRDRVYHQFSVREALDDAAEPRAAERLTFTLINFNCISYCIDLRYRLLEQEFKLQITRRLHFNFDIK